MPGWKGKGGGQGKKVHPAPGIVKESGGEQSESLKKREGAEEQRQHGAFTGKT